MTVNKIESGRDRASGKGGCTAWAAGAGCPARARTSRRAVAPQRGVTGHLRRRLLSLGLTQRSKVSPRPACSFIRRLVGAVDYGYAGFVLAWVATGLVALHVAMGGGLR